MSIRLKFISKTLLTMILLILTACNNDQNNTYLGVWVTIQEANLESLEVLVRLENGNGDIPTGARVKAQTPDNEILWLTYSYDYNLYKGNISNNTKGVYHITVESIINNINTDVIYNKIIEKPILSILSDSAGANVLTGDELDKSIKISVGWNNITNATVYKGTIKNEEGNIVQFSTTENSYILDENTLNESQNYSIIIEAQSIIGDPYFNDYNYYSCNSEESSEYFFNTK